MLYMGREWPQGYTYFRDRCKKAFLKNQNVENSADIETMIKRGEFVIKEVEALYKLKKYRTIKKRYYDE